jgi:hypothetical protein
VIEPPSEEVLERVRSEFGLKDQRARESVEHPKDRIQLQPHLPQEFVHLAKTVNIPKLFVTVNTLSLVEIR